MLSVGLNAELKVALLLSAPIGIAAAVIPDVLQGSVLAAFWGALLARWLYQQSVGMQREQWISWIMIVGLLYRIPMVLGHLAIAYWFYGTGLDFVTYFREAVEVGQQMSHGNFERIGLLASDQPGARSMETIFHLLALFYFLIGESLVGFFALSGIMGFLGSLLFLKAFETEFPAVREARFLSICLFFFPSLAFWTSLLGKDSWMYFFIGWTTFSAARLSKRYSPWYFLGVLVGLTLVTVIRPPIGIAMAASVGFAALVSVGGRLGEGKSAAMLRPIAYVCLALLMAGLFIGVSSQTRLYDKFGQDADFVEGLRDFAIDYHIGLRTDRGGASTVEGLAIDEKSTAAVAQFLPLAVFTFLFRPLVFEAHNAVALLASIDGTLLLMLISWRLRYLGYAVRLLGRSPVVVFCWTAFFLLTLGLSFETNLGVIVRHRTMVLPFLFILLAVPRWINGEDQPQ